MARYVEPWLQVVLGWLRTQNDLALENAALRQQLAMYGRRRPRIHDGDRLFWVALSRIWPQWREACRPFNRTLSCAGIAPAGVGTGPGRVGIANPAVRASIRRHTR
jgi:hypothetical protein